MSILVVAEHDHRQLKPQTANVLSAALQLGDAVDVLVAGCNCEGAAEAASSLAGVARVRKLDAPHYAGFLVENLAMVLAQLAGRYSHVLLPATSFGKNLMPRVAAMLDVAPVSEIIQVLGAERFLRPSHAGNVLETVYCPEPVKLLTVRPSAFPAQPAGALRAPIEDLAAGPDMGISRLLGRIPSDSSRPELATARVVVSGGRGLGSVEAFQNLLEPLADCFSGALAATRAAVDAGFAPNDWQVGQTGKAIAPDVYIALGLSGALQHLAGMRDAKCIVAINKDPDAPIMKVADLALEGDVHEVVPQLIAALKAG